MELPLYRLPSVRSVGLSVCKQTVDFLRGAGSIIVVVSVVIWALSTWPSGNMETSYLATVGRSLSPVGALMGLGWQMTVALVTSFVRKENTLATLGVLYGSGQDGGNWVMSLRAALTPGAGLAFLVVQMLFIPCVATVVSVHQETASWRWTLFSVALLLIVSVALGIAVYQLARILGFGSIS
jgi:ferrous iron transport protein B